MFRLAILLCCFTTSVLSADECAAFNTCLADHKAEWVKKVKVMETDKMDEMAVCYKNHGCVFPVHTNHTSNPEMVAIEACVSTAETAIKTCVFEKTNENVNLYLHRREHGNDGKKKHFKEHHMEEALNASCGSNGTAVHYLRLCLKGLKHCPSKHPSHHDHEVLGLHMEICKKNFTKACEDQMKKVEDAIWECSRNNVTNENYRNCMPHRNFTHAHKNETHKNETHKGKDGKHEEHGKDDKKDKKEEHGHDEEPCEKEMKHQGEGKEKNHEKEWKDKEENLNHRHAEERKNHENDEGLKEKHRKEMKEMKNKHEEEAECKKNPLADMYSEKCERHDDKQKKRGGCNKKEEQESSEEKNQDHDKKEHHDKKERRRR